jgi:hypothetical protein
VRHTRDTLTGSEVTGRGARQKRRRAGQANRKVPRPNFLRPSLPQLLVYWHSELPPLDAEPMGEHTAEAMSSRVPHALAHRDELWERCYQDLMVQARNRLEQEITRLGGNYAHVLDEHVESKYDAVKDESWLQGRFSYMLYRQTTVPKTPPQ